MYSSNTSSKYESIYYSNRKICIFEEHNFALPIWGEVSSENKVPHTLITFDYHTDTRPAFTVFICEQGECNAGFNKNNPAIKAALNNRKVNIDTFCFEDAFVIAHEIRNDEHIKAAYDLNYIDQYIIVNRSSSFETDDRSAGYNAHYFQCQGDNLNEDLLHKIYSLARGKSLILDFDLDFFINENSFGFLKTDIFTKIVKKAAAITIARENNHYEKLNQDQKRSNSQTLMILLDSIKSALIDNVDNVS